MRAVILILSLVLATTAAGQVYRSVDENGKVTYSDAPSSGAKKIHVAPIQTYVNPAVGQGAKKPTPAATAEKKKPPPRSYKVNITSPVHDSTVHQNAGLVSVAVSLSPGLAAGAHKLRLTLNGKAVGEPGAATSFSLPAVDRGAHTLRAAVINASGKVISSSSLVTFHLRRFSVRQ